MIIGSQFMNNIRRHSSQTLDRMMRTATARQADLQSETHRESWCHWLLWLTGSDAIPPTLSKAYKTWHRFCEVMSLVFSNRNMECVTMSHTMMKDLGGSDDTCSCCDPHLSMRVVLLQIAKGIAVCGHETTIHGQGIDACTQAFIRHEGMDDVTTMTAIFPRAY